uniref:F169A protein n=1 Tax=Calidris pygmaea TaxID=425635 RepID=A0A8C3PGR2_9CHAR
MSFPVDKLNSYSHEDLERSAEEYLADLRCRNPNRLEFLSLPDRRKIPIRLTTVGFVPLYGEEQTHKLLALFAPGDLLTAVALYLAGQWWSIDDIVRTSIPARQGLHQVKSVGERIVLYVLNRIIYRTQEMGRNEIPFLCHGSNDYAKILWKKGEAIGFYSVKPKACKQYLEKYPGDHKLLWEVEGPGCWFQRSNIMAMMQNEKKLKMEGGGNYAQIDLRMHLFTCIYFESPPETSKGVEENAPCETPSEPLNGEVTEETGKTSLMAEEETANEVLSGELKLQSESQGEEPLTLFVPLILEPPAKPAEDTVSEKESTEEEQESEKPVIENVPPPASKEEPSDNGLPNSVVNEAAEESVSENVSPKTASSLEDQNEEAGQNSQEPPIALNQSSLIVVEFEGVSFQQPSGPEGQKSQLEEHSEESVEQMDQYTQTSAERAADSSSEEAEIEVPIVDRRNLRRKAKGYKGPPKKKGKPA